MYWTSKLGNKFLKAEIEDNEHKSKAQLDHIRKQPSNRQCADCGQEPTVWSSVNLGVFLCIRCGSIHRGIGTHISIPKGCTGTYLWGPDEIERMRQRGNASVNELYGCGGSDSGSSHHHNRPSLSASDDVWRKYIIDKYEHKKFMSCALPSTKKKIVHDEKTTSKTTNTSGSGSSIGGRTAANITRTCNTTVSLKGGRNNIHGKKGSIVSKHQVQKKNRNHEMNLIHFDDDDKKLLSFFDDNEEKVGDTTTTITTTTTNTCNKKDEFVVDHNHVMDAPMMKKNNTSFLKPYSSPSSPPQPSTKTSTSSRTLLSSFTQGKEEDDFFARFGL